MIYNVYVHKYVSDTLKQYGSIDDVVNRIVDMGMNGTLCIENLPKAPHRTTGMVQLHINIENPEYNELISCHGSRSSTYSLRRILYHIVDNEILLDMGWEPVTTVSKPSLYQQKLAIVMTEAVKLYQYAAPAKKPTIKQLLMILEELHEQESQHT